MVEGMPGFPRRKKYGEVIITDEAGNKVAIGGTSSDELKMNVASDSAGLATETTAGTLATESSVSKETKQVAGTAKSVVYDAATINDTVTWTVISQTTPGYFDGFYFVIRGQADAWQDECTITLALDGTNIFSDDLSSLVGTLSTDVVIKGVICTTLQTGGAGGYFNIIFVPNVPLYFNTSISMTIVNSSGGWFQVWGSLLWRDL